MLAMLARVGVVLARRKTAEVRAISGNVGVLARFVGSCLVAEKRQHCQHCRKTAELRQIWRANIAPTSCQQSANTAVWHG